MCKEGGGCSWAAQGSSPGAGRREGSREGRKQWASETPALWCGGQNHPGDWASVQRLPQLIETKQDSKGSPCKDTVNKRRCFVQPLPFSLMDLVTEGLSVLLDFPNLKHLLLVLGKFTLMQEVQANLPQSPSALSGWSWQQSTWVPTVTSWKTEKRLISVVEHHIFFLKT